VRRYSAPMAGTDDRMRAWAERLGPMSAEAGGDAIPAATVVLLRDGTEGVETLVLQRNSKLAFGGMWVFPGGRVDPDDHPVGDERDPVTAGLDAARNAAVREAAEEAGLVLDGVDLVVYAHWQPPKIAPKRFATWFFAARAPAGDVVVDGGEIHEHAWVRPADGIARRDAGEIELAPPTWVTLHDLARYSTVEEALTAVDRREPELFETHIASVDDAIVALWHGDAGYDSGELDAPGPRHRLLMADTGWTYERHD
jgi:8-oxo-dGTP pyrophosphatase MutT (NUDIX family)